MTTPVASASPMFATSTRYVTVDTSSALSVATSDDTELVCALNATATLRSVMVRVVCDAIAFVITRSGFASTVVVTSLLFVAGVSANVTIATFVTAVAPAGNTASSVTVNRTVPDAPDASGPTLHRTDVPSKVPPASADTNVVRAGSTSLRTTSVASASPLLPYARL